MGTADPDHEHVSLTTYAPVFRGREGLSMDAAVPIFALSLASGIASEYAYLKTRFGRQDVDWFVDSRSIAHEHGKTIESFRLSVGDSKIELYFDISCFYRPDL